jgi:hypothetical protein
LAERPFSPTKVQWELSQGLAPDHWASGGDLVSSIVDRNRQESVIGHSNTDPELDSAETAPVIAEVRSLQSNYDPSEDLVNHALPMCWDRRTAGHERLHSLPNGLDQPFVRLLASMAQKDHIGQLIVGLAPRCP